MLSRTFAQARKQKEKLLYFELSLDHDDGAARYPDGLRMNETQGKLANIIAKYQKE